MRIHVVLPEELVRGVDELVGKRGRSRFIAEATRERLQRERLLKALQEGAGMLDPKKYPYWSTPEKVAQWVHDLRRTPSLREARVGDVPARHKRAG